MGRGRGSRKENKDESLIDWVMIIFRCMKVKRTPEHLKNSCIVSLCKDKGG